MVMTSNQLVTSAGQDPAGRGGRMRGEVDSESLTEGALVWAKITGEPWWPSVVFPNWEAVAKWEIPLPKSTSSVASTHRVIYFLGPVINFAVVPAQETSIRSHTLASLDEEMPPWGGWPTSSRWAKPSLRAQWAEACEEAREMLAGKDCGDAKRGGISRGRQGDGGRWRGKRSGMGRKAEVSSQGHQQGVEDDDGEDESPEGDLLSENEESEEADAMATAGNNSQKPVGRGAIRSRGLRTGGRGNLDAAVVGRRVEVWWDGEDQWFGGMITKYDAKSSKHTIDYDDGEIIVEDLRKSKVRWPRARAPYSGPSTESELKTVVKGGRAKMPAELSERGNEAEEGGEEKENGHEMTPSPIMPSMLAENDEDAVKRDGVKSEKGKQRRGGTLQAARGSKDAHEKVVDAGEGEGEGEGESEGEGGARWDSTTHDDDEEEEDVYATAEGSVVWAKIAGDPWWPAVVFPNWKSVENWEIPLPTKLSKVAATCRVVYFLGPVINFAVVPAQASSIRNHTRASLDSEHPPWGGWPTSTRWAAKSASSQKLREQWMEACEEARSMLVSASKLDTLRERKIRKESQTGDNESGGEGVVRQKRTVPRRQAKTGGLGGIKVVGRRVEVWWDGDRTWFAGQIAQYQSRTGRHLIKYDDGDEEVVDLRKQRLRWLNEGEGRGSGRDSVERPAEEKTAVVLKRKRRKKKALFTNPKYLLKAAAAHNLNGMVRKEAVAAGASVDGNEESMEMFESEVTKAEGEETQVRKRKRRKALFTKQKKLKPPVTVTKRKYLIQGVVQEVTSRQKPYVKNKDLFRKRKRKALFTKRQKVRDVLTLQPRPSDCPNRVVGNRTSRDLGHAGKSNIMVRNLHICKKDLKSRQSPVGARQMVDSKEDENEENEEKEVGDDENGVQNAVGTWDRLDMAEMKVKKRKRKPKGHLFTKRPSPSRASLLVGRDGRSGRRTGDRGAGKRMGRGRGGGSRVAGAGRASGSLEGGAVLDEVENGEDEDSGAEVGGGDAVEDGREDMHEGEEAEGCESAGHEKGARAGETRVLKRKKRKSIFTKRKKIVLKPREEGVGAGAEERARRVGRAGGRVLGRGASSGGMRVVGTKRMRSLDPDVSSTRASLRHNRDTAENTILSGNIEVKVEPEFASSARSGSGMLSSELIAAASAAAGAHLLLDGPGGNGTGSNRRQREEALLHMDGCGERGLRPEGSQGLAGTAMLGLGPRSGKSRRNFAAGMPVDESLSTARPLKSLSSGVVIWAKQHGLPWWPAVVFRGWAAWRRYGLPMPRPESAKHGKPSSNDDVSSSGLCKGSQLPLPAHGYWIVHFLGQTCTYALLRNDETVMRHFVPPPEGWVSTLNVTNNLLESANCEAIPEQIVRECDETTVGGVQKTEWDVAADKIKEEGEEKTIVEARQVPAKPNQKDTEEPGVEDVGSGAEVREATASNDAVDQKDIEEAVKLEPDGMKDENPQQQGAGCTSQEDQGFVDDGERRTNGGNGPAHGLERAAGGDDEAGCGDELVSAQTREKTEGGGGAEEGASVAVVEGGGDVDMANVHPAGVPLSMEEDVRAGLTSGTERLEEDVTQNAEMVETLKGAHPASSHVADLETGAESDGACMNAGAHVSTAVEVFPNADEEGADVASAQDAAIILDKCQATGELSDEKTVHAQEDGPMTETVDHVSAVCEEEVRNCTLQDSGPKEEKWTQDDAETVFKAASNKDDAEVGNDGHDAGGQDKGEVPISSDHRVSISSLLCEPEEDASNDECLIVTPWGTMTTPRQQVTPEATVTPRYDQVDEDGGGTRRKVFDNGGYDFSDFFTAKARPKLTWVRTVALPMYEGHEIVNNLESRLTVQEAARAAEDDVECCGFVRQVTENWFYWKRAGTGMSRIFRQDAASVSGKWETFFIEERMPTTNVCAAVGCEASVAAQQRAEHEVWERHQQMLNQHIKPSQKKNWLEAVKRAEEMYLNKIQQHHVSM